MSPFPGVDPRIEFQGLWPDFHARLIALGSERLAEIVPPHYDVRIDERVTLVRWDEPAPRGFVPDVAVVRGPGEGAPAAPWAESTPGGVQAAPVVLPHAAVDETRETFLEIRHRPTHELVAVLEVLSPSNKTGEGRAVYLEKRRALIAAGVHLVELDLLLAGRRLPMGAPLPPGDGFAIVTRAAFASRGEVYAWPLTQAPPRIPIPLLPPDPDAVCDLAALVREAQARGRYERVLDPAAPWPADLAADVRGRLEAAATGRHKA